MRKQMFETGTHIGNLTLLKRYRKNRRPYWLCQCDCGNIKDIREDSIKSGRTISCGCIQKEHQYKKKDVKDCNHPEYHIANGIFQRCFNKDNCNYHSYGARGITINLNDFPNVLSLADYIYELRLKHNDTKQRILSVDRIDNNRNYEKSNIRLTDMKTQSNNRRNTIYVNYCGEQVPLTIACEKANVNRNLVYKKIYRYSFSAQKAFDYYLQKKGGN